MQAKKRKNSMVSNIVLISLFIAFILGLVIARFSGRVLPNTEGAVGNTACNLYNGGLFCESDDKIYFSNLKDSGTLYSMSKELSNFEILNDDTVGCINNTRSYVVYSRQNYIRNDSVKHVFQFSFSGIYRVSKKGSHAIGGIYAYNVGNVGLIGNDVYYQKLEKSGKMNLYRIDLDGKKDELCLEENIVPGTLTSNKIYYAGTEGDHYIYSYDLKSKQKIIVYKGNCLAPALVGGNIYFISLSNNYALAKVDEYGQSPTILVDEKCSFYNITPDERYAIYQIDDGKKNRLEIMNLSTLEKTTIRKGDYNGISVIGDRVFFREFGTDDVYYFSIDNPSDLKVFDPPVLSEGK